MAITLLDIGYGIKTVSKNDITPANADGDAGQLLQDNWSAIVAQFKALDEPHNHHELYYTEDEVDNLLIDKSSTSHLHDERYYTKAEVDALLNAKGQVNSVVAGLNVTVDATDPANPIVASP